MRCEIAQAPPSGAERARERTGEAVFVRTEAEIRRKLREVERKKQQKPLLWTILVLDVYSEILEWVLKEKPGRKK